MTKKEYTEYLERLNNSDLKKHAVNTLLKEQLGIRIPDWMIEVLYNICLMRDEKIYLDSMGEATQHIMKLRETAD